MSSEHLVVVTAMLVVQYLLLVQSCHVLLQLLPPPSPTVRMPESSTQQHCSGGANMTTFRWFAKVDKFKNLKAYIILDPVWSVNGT